MAKAVILTAVVILILIQIIPVTRDNPPVAADFDGPSEIKEIFKTSCYDCHSNETTWPWYAHVAPVSWLVASDVSEGRQQFNFSEWQTYSPLKKAKLAEGIGEEVKDGEMPLTIYLIMHSSAKLDDMKKDIIYNWVASHGGELRDDRE